MHKPPNHNAVSPYLLVADAEAALAFAKATFGSEPIFIHRRDSGEIGHAEFVIEDSVVMLGQMPDATGCHVHVYVPEVDRVFARAKAAGGSVVQELSEKGDGDRRGGITDPAGTTWWLSQYLDPAGRESTGEA
ncbi:VOC family protein [Bosea sp. BH3]|uniref:VOC family protein n=1 Tax=Bosea sp. BH3 TaxID=2871701 RepID=UPI0021CB88D7|nr:VOC family protein [Bosea sp. BH3]MCU4180657.1 VOC family protein [Bosea sp. BH3]